MTIVDILGTPYTLHTDVNEADDETLQHAAGYTDTTTKTIVIGRIEAMESEVGNINVLLARTLRHEIVHAYLHESGLDAAASWAADEAVVDWIALQMPKMMKTVESLYAKNASESTTAASVKEAGKDGTE